MKKEREEIGHWHGTDGIPYLAIKMNTTPSINKDTLKRNSFLCKKNCKFSCVLVANPSIDFSSK